MTGEQIDNLIRWAWTVFTAAGTLYAAWNLKEALIDNWANTQVRPCATPVQRMQFRGAVGDQGLLFAALALECLAGVGALAGYPLVPLVALCAEALALIALSFTQTRRRQRLFKMSKGDAMSTGLSIGPGFETWIVDHQATPLSDEIYFSSEMSTVMVEWADAQGQKQKGLLFYNKLTNEINVVPFALATL